MNLGSCWILKLPRTKWGRHICLRVAYAEIDPNGQFLLTNPTRVNLKIDPMNTVTFQKTRARLQAKQRRAAVHNPGGAISLMEHFPAVKFRGAIIGGYWPLPGELDIRPLLDLCHDCLLYTSPSPRDRG